MNPQQNSFIPRQPTQPELVPVGQSYSQQTYEPNHMCSVCGHVHTCQDCHRILQFRQALEPQETKYMEPVILNTAKKMARKFRRTETDPYSRINVPKNVGISQDDILERTIQNPALSITDIVNQIIKENEETRTSEDFSLPPQNILSFGTGDGSIAPSSSQQIISTEKTTTTTQTPTTIPPIMSSATPSSTPFILTDPSLGFKKATIKYALPRQPSAAKKPLPNPVTPNLKMASGGVLSEMGVFFKRLWGWY
ncbi:11147_t:CDS:2 [Acaulospora morrowiae]|uniref:11147_t:CDS:1 n=1 Tax=Acaulospora morrowiae TaxID=94023 RepID=A0A9N9A972_9GLOM|nr:11147_t:CDS:2 [Acaulospora morrowiae]